MRILLTGGSGFVGKYLLELLSNTKNKVIVLNKSNYKNNYKNIKLVKVSLSKPNTYKKILIEFRPEIVVHLAWEKIPFFDHKTCKINLDNSILFFENIFSLGSCKKIIIAGTCLEYNIMKGVCKTKINGEPYNYFTWAKHSLKSWLEIEAKKNKINMIWLRIFYAYGPFQRSGSLLPTIFNSLQKGKLPNIKNIRNKNDFVFVYDVATIFYNSIFNKIKSGVYNCSSGKSVSVIKLISIAEKIVNKNNKYTDELKKINKNKGLVNFWGSNYLTNKYFQPLRMHSLEEGIKISYKYYKIHKK